MFNLNIIKNKNIDSQKKVISIIILIILFSIIVWLIVWITKKIRLKVTEIKSKKNKKKNLPLIKSTKNLPKLKRPYVNVYDDKGDSINVVLVEFIMSKEEKEFHDKNKDKIIFLGISSYLEFPNPVINKHDPYSDPKHEAWKFNYKEMFPGWLYCFRDPDKYIPSNITKLFMSESDFTDETIVKPDPNKKKKYDFIYFCPKSDEKNNPNCNDDWTAHNKNWELALKCLKIICSEYNLKGLLVGRENCNLPDKCSKNMETTKFIPWYDLLKKYQECKFIFVPNIHDASPRVITEAMCSNLAILVNKNIVGGWKYVTPETGTFFTDENDLRPALNELIQNLPNYKPRKHYIDNYGVVRSGKKLLDFVRQNYGDKIDIPEDCKYIVPRFEKKGYKIAES